MATSPPESPAAIAAGYTSDGSALQRGSVMLDGTAYPAAPIKIALAMLNRHGLIAGATGTGKTKTIQFLTSQHGKAELSELGGLSKAPAGVILRSLITLENNGGEAFFGEPAWEPADLLQTDSAGNGKISALQLCGVADKPQLCCTFLMRLLAEFFHELPGVGDQDLPKLVFFFDEAHLLFTNACTAFLDQVTQAVRLIRFKAVGILFISQLPADVPDGVLGQLGNRVQHALPAFTPDDADNLARAVRTYPRAASYDLAGRSPSSQPARRS
jgi:DNA helicase HerA-like ATPase